ncbi:hypothetical protein, partial [Zoogloea sp. 1C4]|uniref:hypothetical protein n=1 Tax=Zoogloea sp. 1C4 TaxID=2570190 RepID=UPI001D179D26
LAAVLQHHAHRTLAHLRGKLVRFGHGSILSEYWASTKSGAVQSDLQLEQVQVRLESVQPELATVQVGLEPVQQKPGMSQVKLEQVQVGLEPT